MRKYTTHTPFYSKALCALCHIMPSSGSQAITSNITPTLTALYLQESPSCHYGKSSIFIPALQTDAT